MKVLQLVKYYYPSKGGMESVVKSIVEGIAAINSSIEFTIYANHHYAALKKVQKHHGIKVIQEFTPLLFKSQPLNIRYSSLRSSLDEADIVHHHYPFPNMEIALLRNATQLKGKKLIVTWHANIKNSRWSFIKRYYNPLIKKILDQAQYIVVTSPQLFENSDILKDYKEKVKVIPLCFDPSHNIEADFGKSIDLTKPRKVLFVGKLRAYKGLSYLIDAIVESGHLLTIVGDGEEEPNLIKKVKDLNLNNRITFKKNVNDEELTKLYKGSDLFVLPSINEAEAFGVVQLEAMAHGLPVINTKLNSGVPYVSLDRVTGLTVKPKSVSELKQAIDEILNDKHLYETYSINSIERSKLFTREKLAQAYIELYNS
jgi:rhamnosyl/mannosyltransferase